MGSVFFGQRRKQSDHGPAWVSRAGERGSRGGELALHPSYDSPCFSRVSRWGQHHGLPGNRRMGAAREFLSKNAAAERAEPMRPWAAVFFGQRRKQSDHGPAWVSRAGERGSRGEELALHPSHDSPCFSWVSRWDQHHGLPGNRRMGAAREFLSKNAAAERAEPMRPWAACFSANEENNLTTAPHGFRALESGVLVERISRSTHPTTHPAFPGFLGGTSTTACRATVGWVQRESS